MFAVRPQGVLTAENLPDVARAAANNAAQLLLADDDLDDLSG